MTDFVAKPVRKHAIVEAILRALPSVPLLCHSADRVDEAAQSGPRGAASASPQGSERPMPVDLAAFDALAEEVGSDGVRQILAVFTRDTTQRLARMRELSFAADRDTIEIEAHTLKGASGTFGLHELSALARSLEAAVDDLSEEAYREALDGLEAAFAAARERIPLEFLEAA